jgi:phosphonate transport system substrate-binding protein
MLPKKTWRMKSLKQPQFANALRKMRWLVFALALGLFLTGCSTNSPTPTPTETVLPPTETALPTPLRTSIPLGSLDNPIVIGYIVSSNSQGIQAAGQPMIDYLSEETGLTITYQVFEDAQSAFNELRGNEIDFIWLHPLTYLAAYDRDLILPMFVSNHFGLFKYGTQFLANRSSGFIQYFDTSTNKSTTSADVALLQFEGKRPCWTEPSSLSGTIVPYGLLAKNGVQFMPPAYTQSSSATVRALYIKGICDFGATFAYTGDPRTSSQVINDLTDAMEQIIVIWRSDPVIPSLSFHAAKSTPDAIVDQVSDAILKLSLEEDGNSIFSSALDYDFQGLMEIDDDYFDQVRELVNAARIVPYQHLGY